MREGARARIQPWPDADDPPTIGGRLSWPGLYRSASRGRYADAMWSKLLSLVHRRYRPARIEFVLILTILGVVGMTGVRSFVVAVDRSFADLGHALPADGTDVARRHVASRPRSG